MKLPRRQFLHLAAGAAALPGVSRLAWAQTYPAHPVRIIVGFPAGNASDIIVRLMAQSLSERLGQQFVVENRPGAGGTIGTEVVVKAPPDGYTLLMEVVTTNVVNAMFYANLNYNFIRDIAPVASVVRGPIHRFQPKPFQSSLPMQRRIRVKLIWPRPVTGPRPISLANCSR